MSATPSKSGATTVRDARAALQRGDPLAAEAICRDALAHGQNDAAVWTLLALSLRPRDASAAEAALLRALERDPRSVDAHFHLGNLRRDQRRFADAANAYEEALRLAPGHASLLNNLGLALEGCGTYARAETCYREVLRGQPDHRQAMGNLAHLLCRNREYEEALRYCERYLQAFADADATVWVDHAICIQHHLHDDARAEASLRRAVSLAPDDPPSLVNLGSALIGRGDFAGAADLLARAVDEGPLSLYAASLLALARQHLCAWDGLDALHAQVAERIARSAPDECLANPLATLSMPIPPSGQRRVAEAWTRFSLPSAPPIRPVARPRPSKLRIGYVSSDFRHHAVAYLLCEVWERHDRTRFETTAYSIGPREDSPLRARVERAFDRFHDAFDETPTRTAERIRGDAIDVLIDLNGHTRGARGEIFAMRPAPLQLSWLGYLGTQGAPWIDYVVTDRFAAPEALQQAFTERFLYLPDCYCPSDTRREVTLLEGSRTDAALPEQGFVFCCFNNPSKILPVVFDVWMKLLHSVPGSVLWLSPGEDIAIANLRREAAVRGIAAHRLVFAEHVPLPEHLARHAHADLFLDTTPHSAGTTANDALLMGVPVLTCAGETMASRVAGSQLHAIGLPELVTESLAEYEARALSLAQDRRYLSHLRERLVANRRTTALFDMARFTQNLEAALNSIAG
jgi:predicted O-linked N-acetylglucosamine transferase (SPINDLY family)